MTEDRDNLAVTAMGFTSEKELSEMVCAVDLTDSVIFSMFENWKKRDGSKDGLQNVLEFQRGRDDGEKFKKRFEQDEPFDDGHGDSWPPT